MIQFRTIFIVSLFFVSLNLHAQCWQTVIDNGGNNIGGDAFYPSDSIGWVSDWGNELYKTSDGGLSWEIQETGELDRSTCIFFLNEEIGWVGHSSRSIFKTIDAGQNWLELDYSIDELSSPKDIEFLNIDTGYMVSNYARVYRSVNGGETWEIVFENEDWQLASLDFVNSQEGWVAGSIYLGGPVRVLHTIDAGETWEEQLAAPSSSFGSFGPNVDLHFLNDQLGWFVNYTNLIYKTEDGGETWDSFSITEEEGYFMRVFFVNDTLGWVSSRSDEPVYVSTDGGESWNTQSTAFSLGNNNTSLFMTGPDNGVAVYWGYIKHYQGGPANCDIQLISPSTAITALQPEIKWHKVLGCVDGYRLSVGLIPGGTEIIGPLDVGLDTSYLLPFALLEDMEYYVNIVPYNHVHGLATTCGEPFAFTSVSCPPTTLIDTSFCDPPFVWADTSFEEAGTYLFEYMTPLGCDSVVVLALTHEDDIYTEIDTALTVGQPYNGVLYESDTLITEIYTASNGCDSIVQIQLTIVTRTQEPDFISQWQVFPNPTDSELWFRFSSQFTTFATLKLYDAQGQQVFATDLSLHTGENNYQLKAIRDWPVGLYWYQLDTEEGRLSGKVIKE